MEAEEEIRLCKRCGGRTISRGIEVFATPPHKRRKFTCAECGHTSSKTVKSKEECEGYVAEQSN